LLAQDLAQDSTHTGNCMRRPPHHQLQLVDEPTSTRVAPPTTDGTPERFLSLVDVCNSSAHASRADRIQAEGSNYREPAHNIHSLEGSGCQMSMQGAIQARINPALVADCVPLSSYPHDMPFFRRLCAEMQKLIQHGQAHAGKHTS
jgi:hypothetical protein